MQKSNKGITLISLIILIVALLVLASITLASITGEESVIKYAQNAQASTEISDNRNQGILENIIDIGTEGILGDSSLGGGSEISGTKLIDIASIGDYVNYDPTSGGNANSSNTTYTSVVGSTTEHGNGYGSQTFSAQAYKNSGGKWRILNIEGEKITLISDLIYQDSGTTMGTDGLYLQGGLGYIWAEEELHRISAIYGHGDGADLTQTVTYYYGGPNDQDGSIEAGTVEAQQGRKTNLGLDTPSGARALTVEDVNKICGKDTTYTANYSSSTYEKNLDNARYYPTLSGTSTTGKSSEQSTFSGSYYNTYYSYTISSANTDTTVQTNQNTMLKPGICYWLASRCVYANSSYAYFRVHYVLSSGGVNYYYTCYCGGGNWEILSPSWSVRVVVMLKSGIQTSDTEYDSTTGWNLAK